MKTTLTSQFFAAPSSRKLIVVLHGRGDSLAGFRWLPSALQLPANYLLVNAPDEYYTGFSWYDLPPNQAPGVMRSRALLDQLFDEVEAGGFKPADCVLFGFSQGCLMTLEWGGRSPRQLAGFVGISGYCLDPAALLSERSPASQASPWLITHGTADDVLDYAVTAAQVAALKAGGWPIEFHAFAKEHTIDDKRELPLLRAWLAGVLGLSVAAPR